MGCCLAGCVRLIGFTLWRAIAAALLAVLLARVDNYIEGSRHRDTMTGKAWRLYRSRSGKKVQRCTPPGATKAIDTEGRTKP